VLGHSRELNEAAQLYLAPLAADAGVAQRAVERGRRRLERAVLLGDLADLLVDGAVGALALLLHRAHLLVELLELVTKRLHEAGDLLLLRSPVGAEDLRKLVELRLALVGEAARCGLKGAGGERLKGLPQRLLGSLEPRHALSIRGALGAELGRLLGTACNRRVARKSIERFRYTDAGQSA
jgi:hypothetical protein